MLLSRMIHPCDARDLKRLQLRDLGEGMPADNFVPFEPVVAPEAEAARPSHAPAPPIEPQEQRAAAPASEEENRCALEAAYRQGREDALREAREQFGHASDMLAQALEEVSQLRGSLLQNSSNDMLRLVMSIVRQVLHAEISVNPRIIAETIDRALKMAVRADYYHVRVNPADLEVVTERKPLFLAAINGLQNLSFQADPAVGRGGCLLESEFGDVDATIDGQLDQIHRSLLATLDQS